MNGFEVDDGAALPVGVSVPHGNPVGGVQGSGSQLMPNVYAISTDLGTGVSRFTWLTNEGPRAKNAVVGQRRLTRIGGGRYVVLHEVVQAGHPRIEYRSIDSQGRVLGSKTWRGETIKPMSQPLLIDRRLLWVGSYHGPGRVPKIYGHYLYGLNLTNPMSPNRL